MDTSTPPPKPSKPEFVPGLTIEFEDVTLVMNQNISDELSEFRSAFAAQGYNEQEQQIGTWWLWVCGRQWPTNKFDWDLAVTVTGASRKKIKKIVARIEKEFPELAAIDALERGGDGQKVDLN